MIFASTVDDAFHMSFCGKPTMAFILGPTSAVRSTDAAVRFGTSSRLRQAFRGRELPENKIERLAELKADAADEILASKGDRPWWLFRRRERFAVEMVAVEPPELPEPEYLFDYLDADHWASLLPLLHFVQNISGWEMPCVRAQFMFDDPNLHWSSYGYINYSQLVEEADYRNFHVSFAMVPLDSWFIHRKTAALFRQKRRRLSLLIHGNNHTYNELVLEGTDARYEELAVQALDRIQKFERRSGIMVQRVIAPPHGACSNKMGRALLRAGFEAACISRGSLMDHNPRLSWRAETGLAPAEFFEDGLPVIPRRRLKRQPATLLLAALLGQPLILVGHHTDLMNGLGLLAESAELINSLGNVQWAEMGAIAETNYTRRCECEVLRVRMYSRKIRLTVPEGTTQFYIERPWLAENRSEQLSVRKAGQPAELFPAYGGELIPTKPGDELIIASIYPMVIKPGAVSVKRVPAWAVVRRQLCEGRDRLKPAIDRLFAVRNGKR